MLTNYYEIFSMLKILAFLQFTDINLMSAQFKKSSTCSN